jgi:hypothetical protein
MTDNENVIYSCLKDEKKVVLASSISSLIKYQIGIIEFSLYKKGRYRKLKDEKKDQIYMSN